MKKALVAVWQWVVRIAHSTFVQMFVSVLAVWGIAGWGLNVQTQSRERDLVRAFEFDLSVNERRIDWNTKGLTGELASIDGGRLLASPLTALATDGWIIFRGALPAPILKDDALLRDIVETQELVNLANAAMESRERYRQANRSMSNFAENLKTIDANVAEILAEAKPRDARVRAQLDPLR